MLEEALVSVFRPDGRLADSIIRLPYMSRVVHREGRMQTTITLPVAANASILPFESGFCYTHGEAYEVRCYDRGGDVTSISRLSLPERPVTEDDIERIFEYEVQAARAVGQ